MSIVASSPDELRAAAGTFSCVATIGNFDGVHIGHAELLRRAAQRARELNIPSVAITFDPHPAELFSSDPPRTLCTPSQKADLLADQGMDAVLILPFTPELASRTAAQFAASVLEQELRVRELFVGYDFRMGSDQVLLSGSIGNGCTVKQVEAVLHGGRPVSSTRIREALALRRLEEANALLGRCFAVRGMVVHGAGRGGPVLGIPTANLSLATRQVTPAPAVYATSSRILGGDGRWLPSVTSFCKNPTFNGTSLTLETHILDQSLDLYGQELEVCFLRELRGERRFESLDALRTQLRLDMDARRAMLRQP